MGSHVKGCSCYHCRSGMHTKFGGKMLQKFIRKVRRVAKEALRQGKEPAPCVSRGWTD